MITTNDLYHRITIEQAKAQLEAICRTYLDTDSEGNPLIPTNRQRPVMLMGPAGIGKTDIPKQTAEKLGLGYVSYSITHHTRQSALGLPKIVLKNYGGNEVSATEYTASEIVTAVKDEIERTGNPNGILFLDEINCASETLSAPLMQLFQNKTLGQSKIPDGWVIIMAGNPPEYNKSVKEFDAVTRDRIRIINVIPDSKAWLEYAQAKNIHPAIISFIKSDPENIYKFEENENSIVTPRGWEELSITLRAYEAGGFPITVDLIEQFLSVPTIAASFYDYYRMVSEIVSDKEIGMIIDGSISASAKANLRSSAVSVRFMLVECLKRQLHNIALEDAAGASDALTNVADFIEDTYGKSGELEILMGEILSDPTIVKAAIRSGNERFRKYLDDVANAETEIRKKIKKTRKSKGDGNE